MIRRLKLNRYYDEVQEYIILYYKNNLHKNYNLWTLFIFSVKVSYLN